MRSPRALTIAALAVAVIAVSSSAPLTVYAAAPALAIAFYRNAVAACGLAPVAAVGRRAELRGLLRPGDGRRAGWLCVLAGVSLAAHFGTWLPSTKLTSVTTATALVATQPVWAALIAAARRIPVSRNTWIGILVAVLGAALATGADLSVSGRAVVGDALALLGAVLAAIYTTYGERARVSLSTTTYTTVCYGVCALVLLAACAVGGVRLGGYDPRTWAAIGAIVIGPQLLGHSMINYALRRVSATVVAVLLLLEVPGAALLGWALVGQVPAAHSVPGLLIGLAGVAIVLHDTARSAAADQPTNGGTAISPVATSTT